MPAACEKVNLGAACFRCRGFRHACDRKTPSCSRCYKRGITCVYPEAAPSLKKLQQTTESLGKRIKKFKLECAKNVRVSLFMSQYSVYPCTKCFKDLQQCDLRHGKCSRCVANNFDCEYAKTEPKANHVFQILSTMHKVLDHWQDSMNKSKSVSFRLTYSKRGLFMKSNVRTIHDYSVLLGQLKRVLTPYQTYKKRHDLMEFDSTRSIISCWHNWNIAIKRPLRPDPPSEITQALTDQLVHQFCRTPCIPILDTTKFLNRYQDSDPRKQPSRLLIYAICALVAYQENLGDQPYHSCARELLSEYFDMPSLENCQAACLLSYSQYLKGNANSIYAWIAHTMAVELGQPHTRHESMLVWCIYYFNAQNKPFLSLDTLPRLLEPSEEEYYIWNSWVYLIQLQILREQTLAKHKSQETLMELQKSLFEFQSNLLPEWQLNGHLQVTPQQLNSPISFSSTPTSSCYSEPQLDKDFTARLVWLHYLVNRILLYEPFVPMNQIPNTPFSVQSLHIMITTANQIVDVCESIKQPPIVAFLCINAVYHKIMSFQHDEYSFIARLGLMRSLDVFRYSLIDLDAQKLYH